MDFLYILFLIITSSFLLIKIFEKLSIPKFLGPIIAGIAVGHFYQDIFVHKEILETLSNLAIIMLLFYIGLELNINKLKEQEEKTIVIAVSAFLLPFFAGFTLSYYILEFPLVSSFIIASTISLTAEGILVMLLNDSKYLKTNLGELSIGVGILDDIIGIILVTVIVSVITTTQFSFLNFLPVIFGALVFILGYVFWTKISLILDNILIEPKNSRSSDVFTYSIIFLLTVALFSEIVGLDFSIGAFIAGILLNLALHKKGQQGIREEKRIDNFIKNITFGFLIYFFFFWVGINVEIKYFFESPFLGLLLAVFAFTMKYFGVLLGGYLTKQSLFNSNFIGISTSTKGGIDLIIVEIARNADLISNEIFTSIVVMSLILTFFSPIIFNLLIKRQAKFKKSVKLNSKI